jgi:hypothetical protein
MKMNIVLILALALAGLSMLLPVGATAEIFQLSPANISASPISVRFTNVDNFEHFTVFYKTNGSPSDGFLNAGVELSDEDSVIASLPVEKIYTTNGVQFEFGGGGALGRWKFLISEEGDAGKPRMPGATNYWFYLGDFATNISVLRKDVITRYGESRRIDINMPGLNENVIFQKPSFTVQMVVASRRIGDPVPKVSELHRQAWLLRPDGTAIPQSRKPYVSGGGGGGYMEYSLVFQFENKSTNESAGIVVRVGSALYCREFPSNWDQP